MKTRDDHKVRGQYVDTPAGLFTASGTWFATTEAALGDFAAPVLEREPLPRLLQDTEVWLRLPQTLTLWLLPVLLLTLPPAPAALWALAVYLATAILGPGIVSRLAASAMRWLDKALLQALFYVMLMSMLAAQGAFAALWTGLGGFILLRWGVIRLLTAPLVGRLQARLYPLPVPDQVLRAFIIRAALHYGVSMPELDRMADHIADVMTRHKRKR